MVDRAGWYIQLRAPVAVAIRLIVRSVHNERVQRTQIKRSSSKPVASESKVECAIDCDCRPREAKCACWDGCSVRLSVCMRVRPTATNPILRQTKN